MGHVHVSSRSSASLALAVALAVAIAVVPAPRSPGLAQEGDPAVAPGAVIIGELMASNRGALLDEDGESSDWIELFNAGDADVSLEGWALSDDPARPRRWVLPRRRLAPFSALVVFASGKNRAPVDGELHASFRLSASGEYLGLADPSGRVVSSFAPRYPPQIPGVSYGRPMVVTRRRLAGSGDRCRFLVPAGDLPAAWAAAGFDDSAWTEGRLGIGFDAKRAPTYGDLIATDVETAMRGVNSTVLVRVPFTIEPAAAGLPLALAMRYDDGFVAYLGGVEVARRNAPAAPQWSSRAARSRPDRLGRELEPIAISGVALEAGPAVLAIHGLNSSSRNNDLLVLPELDLLEVESIGAGRGVFFAEPTPGAPNGLGFEGIAPPVTPSRSGGAFAGAFELELSTGDPAAAIRFTLDGRKPDRDSALYAGPIPITGTTTVRARSFREGFLPGPLLAVELVEVDPDLAGFSSSLPLLVVTTGGAPITAAAFTPARLLVIDRAAGGRAAITGPAAFSGPAALEVRGSSSAGRPKRSYKLEIRDLAGQDADASLLDMPPESDWVLHGPYDIDWTLIRNAYIYEVSRRIGRWAPRTRFCELFLDVDGGPVSAAHHAGIYVLMEKIKRGPHRVDIEKIRREDDAEPEITGGYIFKIDRPDPGDQGFVAGGRGMVWVDPKEPEVTPAQKAWLTRFIDGFVGALRGPDPADPVSGYPAFIDVLSWIDHHLLNELASNADAFVLSEFMYKPRGRPIVAGPLWDFDRSLGTRQDIRAVEPVGWSGQRLAGWWKDLVLEPEFARRYRDRWIELRRGPLSHRRMLGLIDDMAAEIEEAVPRNFERWPGFADGIAGWREEIGIMRAFVDARLTWIDTQFVEAPATRPLEGQVPRGARVALEVPQGDILYTVNGPDPRGPGGAPAAGARLYEGPIEIIGPTRIRARARLEGDLWSALLERSFFIERLPLVVTEVMYNPAGEGGGFQSSLLEFIELASAGSDPIDLAGVRLEGKLQIDLGGGAVARLEPGEHVVLVRDLEAFRRRYPDPGIAVAGRFRGILGNASQEIAILGPLGEPFLRFTYEDSWYPETDGGGFSLVVRDLHGDPRRWGEASSWLPSSEPGGSPGRPDPASSRGGRIPGDVDEDGRRTIGDAIALLRHLFLGAPAPACSDPEAGARLLDIDGDGRAAATDAIVLLEHIFRRGPAPALGTGCVPFPGCPAICLPGR